MEDSSEKTQRQSRARSAADKIRSSKEQILSRWEVLVRREMKEARKETKANLRDALPLFIDELAKALTDQGLDGTTRTSLMQIATEHAGERVTYSEYDVTQVIREYELLRKILFDTLETDHLLARAERETILEAFTAAISEASHEYAEMAQSRENSVREEQEEQLGTLQSITELALAKANDLDDLLESILDRVLLTFKSDTIAILLADPTKQFLEVHAARGLEDEIRGKIKVPIGKGVAGTIFFSGEPRKIDDLSGVEVASPILKTRGIQCLIGAPLQTPSGRIGVIHTGRLSQSLFTDKDLILLSLAADRLAQAIEFAKLLKNSQATIRDLQEERRLREQFVNSLTHDLRIPLSSIKMAAEMLQEDEGVSETQKTLSDIIFDNTCRTDRMIQDLLDANRIRAGEGIPVDIENFVLNDIMRETLASLSRVHGPRFEIDEDEPISGHWSRNGVQRIVENLCSNAVKYGDGQTQITISLADLNDRVEISVHNHGPPIPEAEQKELFFPFKRAKRAQRKSIGWGIGLSIVQGLTRAQGGTVTMVSSAEFGTTFKVNLPKDCRQGEIKGT